MASSGDGAARVRVQRASGSWAVAVTPVARLEEYQGGGRDSGYGDEQEGDQ